MEPSSKTGSQVSPSIDEALLPVSDLIKEFVNPLRVIEPSHDPQTGYRLYADQVTISMPMEMDMFGETDEQVSLGAAPPLYHYQTSYEPALHQLKMTITASHGSAAT